MPIPDTELERRFVAVDGATTVDGLRRQLGGRVGVAYVVVALPAGGHGAALLGEISRAVELLGPAALDEPLANLPDIGQPTGAIERASMGFGVAEHIRDRQPRRRLVVLDGGAPIGLLTNESRGSGVSGVPFDLFGPYTALPREELVARLDERRVARTCPHCHASFAHYKLLPAAHAYACPACLSVLATE